MQVTVTQKTVSPKYVVPRTETLHSALAGTTWHKVVHRLNHQELAGFIIHKQNLNAFDTYVYIDLKGNVSAKTANQVIAWMAHESLDIETNATKLHSLVKFNPQDIALGDLNINDKFQINPGDDEACTYMVVNNPDEGKLDRCCLALDNMGLVFLGCDKIVTPVKPDGLELLMG
ncbi:hypothetical protein VPHD528_0136 [Vibrio phage D528]